MDFSLVSVNDYPFKLKFNLGNYRTGVLHLLVRHYAQFKKLEDFYQPRCHQKTENRKKAETTDEETPMWETHERERIKMTVETLLMDMELKYSRLKTLENLKAECITEKEEQELTNLRGDLQNTFASRKRKRLLVDLQEQFISFFEIICSGSSPYYRSGHSGKVELYWKCSGDYLRVVIPNASENKNGVEIRDVLTSYLVTKEVFEKKMADLRYWLDTRSGEICIFNYSDFAFYFEKDHEQQLKARPAFHIPESTVCSTEHDVKTLLQNLRRGIAMKEKESAHRDSGNLIELGCETNGTVLPGNEDTRMSTEGRLLLTETNYKYYHLIRIHFLMQSFKFPLVYENFQFTLERPSAQLLKLMLNTEPKLLPKEARYIEFAGLLHNPDNDLLLQNIACKIIISMHNKKNLIGTIEDQKSTEVFAIQKMELIMISSFEKVNGKESVRTIAFKTSHEFYSNKPYNFSKSYKILAK